MDQITEDMFNNVNHLIECQRFVMERVRFLEEKRLELTTIIQNLGDSSYKEMLENQIKIMEMKVSINGTSDQREEKAVIIDDPLEKKKSNLKCRYNDRGFCKSRLDCVYSHSKIICDKLLSNGQCPESKSCPLRHPRDCKHWKGDVRGCLRGNDCKYLHDLIKKGINVKGNKNNHDIVHESELQNKIINKEMPTEKREDSLNEVMAAKEILIKEKDEEIAKLRSENDILIENENRMKRIAWKMDQEIKALRAKQS